MRSLRLGSGATAEQAKGLRARLRAAGPDEQRAAAAAAVLHESSQFGSGGTSEIVIRAVERKDLPWTVADAEWLLGRSVRRCDASERFTPGAGIYVEEYFRLALTAGRRFAGHEGFRPDVEHLVARIGDSCYLTHAAKVKLTLSISALLAAASDPTVPAALRHDADGFAPAAREILDANPAMVSAAVSACLDSYGTSVRPTARWRADARAAVSAHPGAAAMARELVGIALMVAERGVDPRVRIVFTDQSLHAARGAVWMLVGACPTADTARLVGEVAVRAGIGVGGSGGVAVCQGLATAAVAALASMATTAESTSAPVAAVAAALGRVRDQVANRTVRKAVDGALADVAQASGVTRGQLVERSVPTLDLRPDGTAERVVGSHVALLQLCGDATPKVSIRWRDASGQVTASVPADVRAHPEELADLRATASRARKLASQQRRRLEQLLAEEHSWSVAEWTDLYVGHPVVGWTARGLIWTSRAADGSCFSGLPRHDDGGWHLRAHDGSARRVDASERLLLWHPLLVDGQEIRRWRDHLLETGTPQPFRQAFRETYRRTPAEEQTRTHSNRFAGHILRYPQARALMLARDWNAKQLGSWDGGYNGEAVRTVADTGWRAHFHHDLVEDVGGPLGHASLCSSDRVRFERLEGDGRAARWVEQELDTVPPRVFTEVMRDVDLFVGVTTIATDPTWADGGVGRARAYWGTASVGALNASAEIRREALRRLLPRTRIADRARIEGPFLVVEGSVRTYRIHLGSGNVLMSPDDRYLCIVPDHTRRHPTLFLPFEQDDGLLDVILSKAFLLADDAAITDPVILEQFR
ncbi:DUF4132 domain-containing protein [Intrasporangium flavum]|uniref:DUF4132 domain-containing protein n=1 Tax=Intrasporangium flavum TaxID=1428657 RepID=UPI001A966412|nr:DUF4132 domain-containing protein [Intrasporangium flavum]